MQTSSWSSLLQFLSFSSFNCILIICHLTVDLPASLRLLRHQPVLSLALLSSPLLFSPSSIHLFFCFQTYFVSFVGLAFLFVCVLLSACVDEAFLPDFI